MSNGTGELGLTLIPSSGNVRGGIGRILIPSSGRGRATGLARFTFLASILGLPERRTGLWSLLSWVELAELSIGLTRMPSSCAGRTGLCRGLARIPLALGEVPGLAIPLTLIPSSKGSFFFRIGYVRVFSSLSDVGFAGLMGFTRIPSSKGVLGPALDFPFGANVLASSSTVTTSPDLA